MYLARNVSNVFLQINDYKKKKKKKNQRNRCHGKKIDLAHTVEPVYNGHPRDLKNWPLNTGSLKILTGRCLMSIFMAYHTKTVHARKQL